VDALLLDSWHPEKIGGTGRVFSWEGVAEARRGFPEGLKLVAAGGLNPANVKEAIETLLPDVVDVSSGVEVGPGLKEKGLMDAFIQNARGAGRGT
jgi:phosphoribosylanthranilate isomerase